MSTSPDTLINSTYEWASVVSFALEDFLSPKIRNQGLNEISEYYFSNLLRLNEMVLLPSFIGDLTSQIQRSFDHAELALTGTLESGILANESHPRYSEIVPLSYSIYNANRKEHFEAILGPDGRKHMLDRVWRGTRPLLLLSDKEAKGALRAFLSSFTIGSWTAFETMAADLWEVAINTHPSGLAEMKGVQSRISRLAGAKKKDSDEGDREPKKRQVSLQEILRYEYKIHDKMGAVLRADRRFDTLSRIREAYSLAFHEKSKELDSALANQALDSLNAIRNILVHRGGKIDAEYFQKASYLPLLPKGAVGEHVEINGKNLAPILRETRSAALALISAVDLWIGEN